MVEGLTVTVHTVFLAGKYEQQPMARTLAEQLQEDGHRVVSRWMFRPYANTPDTDIVTRQRFAREDLEDVAMCDVLVFFPHPYNSRVFEEQRFVALGAALAQSKRIFVLGRLWSDSLCLGTQLDEHELQWMEIFKEVRRAIRLC